MLFGDFAMQTIAILAACEIGYSLCRYNVARFRANSRSCACVSTSGITNLIHHIRRQYTAVSPAQEIEFLHKVCYKSGIKVEGHKYYHNHSSCPNGPLKSNDQRFRFYIYRGMDKYSTSLSDFRFHTCDDEAIMTSSGS